VKRLWPMRGNPNGPFHMVAMVVALCITPLYLMWDVLFVNPSSHLSNPGQLPSASTVTDLDGAARLAYLLSDMGTPWSVTHLISSPTGSSVWRLESLTQLIQVLFLWLASQFAQPMLAVNLFVLLGWILTGLATYLLARHFSCSVPLALVLVVIVQLTPSMRFMAANFTSYVFVAVPLLTIYAAIKFFQELRWSKFFIMVLSLFFTGIFDPYWFLFSVLNCAVIGFFYLVQELVHEKSKRSIGFFGALVGLFGAFCIAVRVLSTQVADSALDRPIAIASESDVQNSVMNFVNWTSSDYTGIGYFLPLLFFLSILLVVVIRKSSVAILFVVALIMIMLSSRIAIPFLHADFVLAQQIRHIMPGVRFFDRAALIALPLIVIVIGKTLQDVGEKLPWRKLAPFIAPVVLLVSVFTYPSITRPDSTRSYEDWSEIREQLSLDKGQRVLALPFTRRGRDWIEQASFQKPLVNDFVETVNNQQVILNASNGPGALAAYLASIGVSHVFSIDQELARFFDYKLEAPRFISVGEIILNGFGEGADYKMTVYKVVLQPQDSLCVTCNLGNRVVTEVRMAGDLVYPPEVDSQGQQRWWIGDKNSRISFASMSQQVSAGSSNRKIELQFSIAPCASEVVVQLKYDDYQAQLELNRTAPNKVMEIPINDSPMSEVEIVTLGDACQFEGDPRQILVQVSDVRLS
jgi:hypothetical protein